MEFRGNSTQQHSRNENTRPHSQTVQRAAAPQKSSKALVITAVIAGIVVLLVIVLCGMMYKKNQEGGQSIMKDRFQAVFLTNGQVYFGKVDNITKTTVQLSKIYYLQVQQNVQPADKDKEAQVTLAKLGDELHGPEDTMYINRDQVLFWENLKDNGKVTTTIKEHEAKK